MKTILTIILFSLIFSEKVFAGIGISYDQTMNTLEPYFKMEKSTPVSGHQRYIGMTGNGFAALEIIGNKKDISAASLMVDVAHGGKNVALLNAEMIIAFLNNLAPEYNSWAEWTTDAVNKVSSGVQSESVKIIGRKIFTMKNHTQLGVLILSASQAINNVQKNETAIAPKHTKILSQKIQGNESTTEDAKTARLSCYDIGYRYGDTVTKSMNGQKFNPEWDFISPVRCRNNSETERGMAAGIKDAL